MRMQQLLSGFEVSQALYVIAELGVATALLDGPRSVDDLAAATGADVDALGRIIRFLASLDVFRRQANRGGHRPRPDAPRRRDRKPPSRRSSGTTTRVCRPSS
jgi:Dimerisation domain